MTGARWRAEREAEVAAIMDRASVRMTEHEARAHHDDMLSTFIIPGADPRVPWERSHGLGQFETGTRALPRAVGIITASRTDSYRYVPEDVQRWRDPEHRAAMTERARKYATERVTYSRAV